MNSIKCKNCGLTNFPNDPECRRCGYSFLKSAKTKDKKIRGGFSVWTLLLFALFAGIGYYFYTGTQASVQKVNADEANRAASEPTERPLAPGSARSEYDRQKKQTYAGAVRDSQSLADHNKQIQRTEKMMQQISNGQVGK